MADSAAELKAARLWKANKHRMNYCMEAGKLFYVTHQTPATAVTGQTGWVVTTPTFLIYGANVASRGVLKRMTLSQAGTVAGGAIGISVVVDRTSRFSAGGTAVTPQNANVNYTNASGWTFLYNPTASVAGTGTSIPRYLQENCIAASVGNVFSIDFTEAFEESGLPFGTAGSTMGAFTGSLLVYTWAATTGPTWRFTFEYLED